MFTLFYHIRQIVKCSFDDLDIDNSDDIDGLAIAVDKDGLIKEINTTKLLWNKFQYEKYFDCLNGSVIPGFVDAHTHPVWAGDRVHEFSMKLSGASYLDIHNAGGGIHFSVSSTEQASEDQLYQLLFDRIQAMIKNGTTTIECKTGYGLKWDTELKMLNVLNRAKLELPVDISITYLAAHAVPRDSNAKDHTKDIVNNQIPQLANLMKDDFYCDNIDVFCEKGIFELEDTKYILEAGVSIGLNINAHSDEIYNIGGTKMISCIPGCKIKSISHLEKVDQKAIKRMSENDVTAVILPTTAYILRLEPPPVRDMINNKVRCALGTDFNPNAYCLSMPLVMHLACVNFKMSMTEALLGATINSAHSLGLHDKLGSIEPGKYADFLVLKCTNWEHIIYQFGEANQLIRLVIKKGKTIN